MESRKSIDKTQITQKLLGVDLSQANIKKLDQSERRLLKTALSIINDKPVKEEEISKMSQQDIDKVRDKLLKPNISEGDKDSLIERWVKNIMGQRVSSKSIYKEYKKSALTKAKDLITPENVAMSKKFIQDGNEQIKGIRAALEQCRKGNTKQLQPLEESIEQSKQSRDVISSVESNIAPHNALIDLMRISGNEISEKLEELDSLLTTSQPTNQPDTYEDALKPKSKQPDLVVVQKKINEIEKLCLEYEKALKRWEGMAGNVKVKPLETPLLVQVVEPIIVPKDKLSPPPIISKPQTESEYLDLRKDQPDIFRNELLKFWDYLGANDPKTFAEDHDELTVKASRDTSLDHLPLVQKANEFENTINIGINEMLEEIKNNGKKNLRTLNEMSEKVEAKCNEYEAFLKSHT